MFLDVLQEVIALVRAEVREGQRQDDVELRSYEWITRELADPSSTRVQAEPGGRFQPGKMYMFQYNPKYKDTLDYYDTHPVMLHLGTIARGESRLELGVNVSWYPPAPRRFIVERVREMYEARYDAAESAHPGMALEQKKVFLNVYRLRHYLDHLGFSFAIRQYLPGRVVSQRVAIEYGSWERALELNVPPGKFPDLHGKRSLPVIYQDFFRHLRKVNEDRSGRRERIADQRRRQNLYRFVDGNSLG